MALTAQDEQRLRADAAAAPTRTGFALSIGVITAVVSYGSAMTLTESYGWATFCIPFFVGAIVGLFAYRRPIRAALQTILVAMLLAVLSLREGIVCCLYALPFVLSITILGAACTATVRRHVRSRRARRALGIALVLACIAWQGVEGVTDDPARHPLQVAHSEIVIAAPPERAFAALSGTLEVRSDWPWFLRIGLPMPSRLTVRPPSAGGQVTGVFSQGVAHGHVTEWIPGRTLAYAIDRYDVTDLPFHITRLGRGPSYGFRAERVADWLTIVNTRWELAPRADGGTDLRREITWRRHLAPGFYFGWLQQTIIQRGQDRLLALVRERVEVAPDQAAPVATIVAERRPVP
jgi:hypothetical protein